MEMACTNLTQRLDNAITQNPHLVGRELKCDAESGTVVLHGTVKSYFQKQMAQEAVRHVDGVQWIDNQLEVHWG